VIAPFIAALISVAGATNADRARLDLYLRDSALARSAAELRQLLASVRESEARKSAILESVADPIVTVDGSGEILELNPAAERVFGHARDQLVGASIERIVLPPPGESGSVLGESALERKAILGKRVELSGLRKDGTTFPIEMTVTEVRHDGPPMLTVYLCDLTERKRVEDQMRQQQAELAHALRVATMGQMAAEVGHEINQPLAAIVNYAKGLSARLLGGAVETTEMAKTADKIAAEALRAAEVVRRQREFLRRGAPQRAPVELNGLVRDAAHLIEPDARRHEIAVRIALDPSIPLLDLDRIQIEQVVLNLLRNGLESIVEAGRARNELVVETCMVDGGAQVTVSDTGVGLPAATGEEVFAPFYTTKPKGLGLGLSIGRSIIEAHGGKMWAAPNPVRGATFGFRLPLPESDAATAGKAAAG
jgi:two-component system sensor kinase FixL